MTFFEPTEVLKLQGNWCYNLKRDRFLKIETKCEDVLTWARHIWTWIRNVKLGCDRWTGEGQLSVHCWEMANPRDHKNSWSLQPPMGFFFFNVLHQLLTKNIRRVQKVSPHYAELEKGKWQHCGRSRKLYLDPMSYFLYRTKALICG